MEPRHAESALDFGSVEGFGEDVVGAEVEGFGPKGLVGDAGSDDDERRIGELTRLFEHFLPRSGDESALTEHDGRAEFADIRERGSDGGVVPFESIILASDRDDHSALGGLASDAQLQQIVAVRNIGHDNVDLKFAWINQRGA